MARADDGPDGPSWGALLLVGMVAGVSLGAVMALLLRDRGASGASGSAMALGGGSPPVNIYNVGPGYSMGPGQAQLAHAQARYLGTGS